MKVKELRTLLNDLPKGLTQEEFDDLNVLNLCNEHEFLTPSIEDSGYCEFGEPCKEDGTPLPKHDFTVLELSAFILVPHELLKETGLTHEDLIK